MTKHEDNNVAKRTLRTAEDLLHFGLIEVEASAEVERIASQYAVAITPALASTISGQNTDPDGAVARQYVPAAAELETTAHERNDPIGDATHSPLPGIVHRYSDRCLLMPVQNCAVYCRFCFRREQVGPNTKALSADQLEAALDYIRQTPAIWEVILSGGDPLVMPPAKIARIIEALAAIEHVRVLRLHTRVPAVAPERINDDLIAALRLLTPTYVAVHINHVDELTSGVRLGLERLADAGIPLLAQTVLLRGINDDARALERLFRALVENRIRPYYLHIADKARGTSHFRTSLETGQALTRDLRGRVSGLCQPTIVLDIPGGHGKVPVGPSYVERCGDTWRVMDVHGRFHDYDDG